jgi:hypothetical protein
MDCLCSRGLLCTRSRAEQTEAEGKQSRAEQKRARAIELGESRGDVRRLLSSRLYAPWGPRPSPEGRGCSGSAQADPAKGNWRCFRRDKLRRLQMTILSE